MTPIASETHTLVWDCGTAEVQTLGAMLGPIRFRLPDGRVVQPMAVAPWAEDPPERRASLPGVLQRLRGEWPCVPFGAPDIPEGLPDAWEGAPPNPVDPVFHGLAANSAWTVTAQRPDEVHLSFRFPIDHPLDHLTRVVRAVTGEAAVACTLEVTARRAVETTLALHAVFALAPDVCVTLLQIPHTSGRTFPVQVERKVSVLTPDAPFETLAAVAGEEGPFDLTRMPLAMRTEELVQLCGTSGAARLAHPDHKTVFEFDAEQFPSVLLWISNRGRGTYPWNNRFTALGIEPLRGAFDLGPGGSAWPGNPIARSGTPTSLKLAAGETFSTRYTIRVEP